jgi:hypothetical protein
LSANPLGTTVAKRPSALLTVPAGAAAVAVPLPEGFADPDADPDEDVAVEEVELSSFVEPQPASATADTSRTARGRADIAREANPRVAHVRLQSVRRAA